MNLSKTEAEAALREIESVVTQTRRAIAGSCCSAMLILWGVIWVIGYSATQFFPRQWAWTWGPLSIGGIAFSWLLGARRRGPVRSPLFPRLFIAWIVLFGYAIIWAYLLHPFNGARLGAYFGAVPMFGYVVAGLWLGRFFIWIGATVTILTVIGVAAFPAYLNLWMAVTCGGSLIISGVYIRRCWR